MDNSRRRWLQALGATLSGLPLHKLFALEKEAAQRIDSQGNFRYIYGDARYKSEFLDFLSNVFHLYPENEFHQLIAAATQKYSSDQDIYLDLKQTIHKVKPFLSELTYALPALQKQKIEMAKQTLQLLADDHRFEGYLEVGSTGRYLDSLEEQFEVEGEKFFLGPQPSNYSLTDMMDRGQILEAGKFISLDNYSPDLAYSIPPNSIGLATVFIGFHHCPLALRESFISAIRDTLRPGGKLILRDHNAHDDKMLKMVALAHDVFNMGTDESWDYNNRELRLFYSLDELDAMMRRYGFHSDGRRLYQRGDPTLNALMLYKKA